MNERGKEEGLGKETCGEGGQEGRNVTTELGQSGL